MDENLFLVHLMYLNTFEFQETLIHKLYTFLGSPIGRTLRVYM